MNSTHFASSSAVNNVFSPFTINFKNILALLNNDTFKIILSAFFGGFFAGWFSNIFESRRRVIEKRTDKYYEHRNTIVQIEHELSPVRIDLSRNISSIKTALENNNKNNIRIILRFYNLNLSSGLSLKILNLDLINMYLEVYVLLQSLNSDFQYINGVIKMIEDEVNREDIKPSKLQNKLNLYSTIIIYLKDVCEKADKKTLELLSYCQVALNSDDKEIKKLYIKKGGQIEYKIEKKILITKSKETIEEENLDVKNGENKPKFLAPYLDLRK